MLDSKLIARDFSAAATRYDEHACLQQAVLSACVTHLSPHLAADARVLDAGCGTGALAGEIAKKKLAWNITGVDIAPGMCSQAASRMPVLNADITALPFASNSFDGALASLSLQWVEPLQSALTELHRALKPGGKLVFATFGPQTLYELREVFAEFDPHPHVSEFLSHDSVARAAEQSGFTTVHESTHLLTEYYPTVRALMQQLKGLGARNKQANRKRGLLTPRAFANIEKRYAEKFRTGSGLAASWEVFYLVLESK